MKSKATGSPLNEKATMEVSSLKCHAVTFISNISVSAYSTRYGW